MKLPRISTATLGLALACHEPPRETEVDGYTTSAPPSSGGSTHETGSSETPATTSSEGSGPDVRWDHGTPDLPPAKPCEEGGDDLAFSHIWIANSNATPNSISKIDTRSMTELGRYATRPDHLGDPSRTSVNSNGDVAVANRDGGVTMFFARREDCTDGNGLPGIQTSTGPDDVLLFGRDDCMAWHTPLDFSSNRPVAWAPGQWNPDTCRYEDNALWTAGTNGGTSTEVLLLDGEIGKIIERLGIPEITHELGLYGGAVDGDGNFWAKSAGSADLVRVDRHTFDYEVWPSPRGGYGIAVDSQGRPWLCGSTVSRFDPGEERWDTVDVGGEVGGCMSDGRGTLWIGSNPLVGIDTETLELTVGPELPRRAHGISIDFEGNVWGVPALGTEAYRVDPVSGEFFTVTGLVGTYTYSDMTGFGLTHAGVPAG